MTDVRETLPAQFPEGAVSAALDRWWDEEMADAVLPGDKPTPDIMKPAVEIDSHRAVRALVTLEEVVKFTIPESVIKEGGYEDYAEMKAHLVTKLHELFEKSERKNMPNAANEQRIASRVIEAREYLELSQEEIADMVGIDVGEFRSIESGESQLSAALLTDIAKALGRGIEFFTADVPARAATERTEFLARAAETLSDQDLGELKRFATYLRSRSEGTAA